MPRIGGKEVDLYLLFRKVQELGGFTKVCVHVCHFEFATTRDLAVRWLGSADSNYILTQKSFCDRSLIEI